MKVAIDISPLSSGHKGRGVGTYTRELVAALKRHKSGLEFIITDQPESEAADLVHYPYFDLFFRTLPLIKKTKTVVTIHDVIPLVYPEFFPSGIKGYWRYQVQRLSLTSVRAVVTDSSASKSDIHTYLSVPAAKITPVHLAASDTFKPTTITEHNRLKKKYSLPDEFFLFVGSINYNKNLPMLIRAVAELNQIPLVINTRTDIYSTETEKQTRIVLEQVRQTLRQVPDNLVKIVTMVDLEDLVCLYSAAKFYVQPSLHEGFGLPVLESLQTGTPVIASQTSSLPEVGGQVAIYFDPTNQTDLVDKLRLSLDMKPTDYKSLINQGFDWSKKFSWDKTARETIKVYQSVLES